MKKFLFLLLLVFGMAQPAFSIIGCAKDDLTQPVENERVEKPQLLLEIKIDSSETPKTRQQKWMDGLATATKICGLVSIISMAPGLFLSYTLFGVFLFSVAAVSMLLTLLFGFMALKGHTRRRRDAWLGIILSLIGLVAWQIVAYYFYD